MRSCSCPKCGADLTFMDDDRDYAFCEYCGARIDLTDRRSRHVHIKKIVNVTAIERIKSEERIANKEFDKEKKEFDLKKFVIVTWVVSIVACLALGFLLGDLANIKGAKNLSFYALVIFYIGFCFYAIYKKD